MTDKETDDVVVVGEGKKPKPPNVIYMRWSKVLNRYVPCLNEEPEALIYSLQGKV